MNDIKSLLIASTVLAIGGLGLYMYKAEESSLDYNDDLSESGSETGFESEEEEESDLEELNYDNYKPKNIKKNEGTKKNIKKNGGTRKKH